MAGAYRGQAWIVHVQGREVLVTDHQYTSTACHHERHQECRFTCKYCDAICQCLCHISVNKFWNWPAPDSTVKTFRLTIIEDTITTKASDYYPMKEIS
jgi:hypothetical protein